MRDQAVEKAGQTLAYNIKSAAPFGELHARRRQYILPVSEMAGQKEQSAANLFGPQRRVGVLDTNFCAEPSARHNCSDNNFRDRSDQMPVGSSRQALNFLLVDVVGEGAAQVVQRCAAPDRKQVV